MPMFFPPIRPLLWLCMLLPLGAVAADDAATCSVRSTASVPTLIELYTSEGYSSCPPADRWLSVIKGRPDTVALAFHVSYWDRLGWKDRFASASYSERQAQQRHSNGARFSYTPQVVINGRDDPHWIGRSLPANAGAATVQVTLTRDGGGYVALIAPLAGAPSRLAAYWALTEDGLRTAVKAGENGGATLTHDFVVRDYLPVPPWAATPGKARSLRYAPDVVADGAAARAINLVLVDADSGRPVQAIRLGC